MPKVCEYSPDVGGPVAWADRDIDDASLTACWEGDDFDGKWVVGKNSAGDGAQGEVRDLADAETLTEEQRNSLSGRGMLCVTD
tara:strand:+ start:64 stop:312 length:249 start_codon:yes stop_codon:yes gene_type:complete